MDKIDQINTIFLKLENIQRTFQKVQIYQKLTEFLLSNKWRIMLKNEIQKELQYFINYILNLRSDLTTRLTEQKNILESAKSEVSKNIQWTTELDQVSELQKIRLDKQIEQFEELQRVLVKV